jgi:hypothetical protein
MLRREERDQLQVLVLRDEVDRGPSCAVDRRVVGNESDALAAQRGGHVGEKHVEAGTHQSVREGAKCSGCACARGKENQRSEESLHGIDDTPMATEVDYRRSQRCPPHASGMIGFA